MTMIPDGYHVVNEITSFRELSTLLKENPSMWVFLGTDGWHGSDNNLNDCERIIHNKDETWLPNGCYITTFVIDPKTVSLYWGELHIKNENELAWLRNRVRQTLDKVAQSQHKNT